MKKHLIACVSFCIISSSSHAAIFSEPLIQSFMGEPLVAVINVRAEKDEKLSKNCFSLVQHGFPSTPFLQNGQLTFHGQTLRLRSTSPVTDPVVRASIRFECGADRNNLKDFDLLLDIKPDSLSSQQTPVVLSEGSNAEKRAPAIKKKLSSNSLVVEKTQKKVKTDSPVADEKKLNENLSAMESRVDIMTSDIQAMILSVNEKQVIKTNNSQPNIRVAPPSVAETKPSSVANNKMPISTVPTVASAESALSGDSLPLVLSTKIENPAVTEKVHEKDLPDVIITHQDPVVSSVVSSEEPIVFEMPAKKAQLADKIPQEKNATTLKPKETSPSFSWVAILLGLFVTGFAYVAFRFKQKKDAEYHQSDEADETWDEEAKPTYPGLPETNPLIPNKATTDDMEPGPLSSDDIQVEMDSSEAAESFKAEYTANAMFNEKMDEVPDFDSDAPVSDNTIQSMFDKEPDEVPDFDVLENHSNSIEAEEEPELPKSSMSDAISRYEQNSSLIVPDMVEIPPVNPSSHEFKFESKEETTPDPTPLDIDDHLLSFLPSTHVDEPENQTATEETKNEPPSLEFVLGDLGLTLEEKEETKRQSPATKAQQLVVGACEDESLNKPG